jgi:hypothetical protein
MALADGQYQYRDLVFGAGTRFGIRSIEGLEDMEVRDGDVELPRGHGSVPAPHYVDAKQPVIQFVVRDEGGTLADDLAALRAAFTVVEEAEALDLTWKRAGRVELLAHARPIAVVHAESHPTVDQVAFPKVALKLADPRIYSSELHQVTLPVYDPDGPGLDYPVDFPKDFPAPAAGVVVHNAGSSDAYPLVRFFGPTSGTTTAVLLRNTTTGQVQEVVTPVEVGQVLTVDNEAHATGSGRQVVGLDGSTRYGDWSQPRVPFKLPPGDSLLRYEVTGATTTLCVLTWRDTWIP